MKTPFRTSSRPRLEVLIEARDSGFTLLEILVVEGGACCHPCAAMQALVLTSSTPTPDCT